MLFLVVLSLFFAPIVLWFIAKSPDNEVDRSTPAYRLRDLYEIENTYGPLIWSEEKELAWPHKQLISIKHSDDTYARWGKVDDIKDNAIKYIGTSTECWLQLDTANSSHIRDYHWGFVRSRGRYYIFELEAKRGPYDLNYDWWNHSYEQVADPSIIESGPIKLIIYRDKKPITIDGKNTNGVAVINIDETSTGTGLIGSDPSCWITLPDPDLPPFMAIRGSVGYHSVLYNYPQRHGDQYLMRAEKIFEIGGYRVTV